MRVSEVRPQVSRIAYKSVLDEAWQQHLAPRDRNAPTVISTFAGCGGSSLGYSMAGYRELLAVENNDNAVATFRANFPDVPIYHGDIKKLSIETCLELAGVSAGELDVLDGSPPCQGFSISGKRDFDDDRNQLFREYVHLLRGLCPRAFVMENVGGMVKGKMKLIFAECLRELKASGYKVKVRLLNAMYFGVPQSRERMIFIGIRDDINAEPSHPLPYSAPICAREAFVDVSNMTFSPRLTALGIAIWRCIKPGENGTVYRKGYYMNSLKIHPDRPIPTIPKGMAPAGHVHWSEMRKLTIEELKRAASFPDEMQFIGSPSACWARIGNSVPPLFMRAIALHIRRILGF